MPQLKIDEREYGLGADVESLPEDPQGLGPRAATEVEAAKLLARLGAFGFESVRSPNVHRVYVLEGGGRRVLTIAGVPLDVFSRGRNVVPEPVIRGWDFGLPPVAPEPAPENPIDEPNPADESPVELVPLEDAPTDPVGVPALIEPEIPADAAIAENPIEIEVPVEEPAPEKPEGA